MLTIPNAPAARADVLRRASLPPPLPPFHHWYCSTVQGITHLPTKELALVQEVHRRMAVSGTDSVVPNTTDTAWQQCSRFWRHTRKVKELLQMQQLCGWWNEPHNFHQINKTSSYGAYPTSTKNEDVAIFDNVEIGWANEEENKGRQSKTKTITCTSKCSYFCTASVKINYEALKLKNLQKHLRKVQTKLKSTCSMADTR
jgi:hypothetical protein